MDVMECALLNAGGQRRGEAAPLAIGGGGPVCGARSGGSHSVDHERAVFAGDPGCLSAGVETLSFLVGLEVIPFFNSSLALGTWQGVFLFEHRHAPHTRHIVLSILGCK